METRHVHSQYTAKTKMGTLVVAYGMNRHLWLARTCKHWLNKLFLPVPMHSTPHPHLADSPVAYYYGFAPDECIQNCNLDKRGCARISMMSKSVSQIHCRTPI